MIIYAFAAFIASRVMSGPLQPRAGAITVSIGFLVLGVLFREPLMPLIAASIAVFGCTWGSFVVLQRVSGIYLLPAVILVLLAVLGPQILQQWMLDMTRPDETGDLRRIDRSRA